MFEDRLYRDGQLVFLEYKRNTYFYKNKHFNNEDWVNTDIHSVFIGLNKKWFERENWYYDGHTSKSVTFLGIQVGITYSYDAKSLNIKDWASNFSQTC